MKRLFLFACMIIVPVMAQARGTAEEPIYNVGTAHTIAVSSTSWTKSSSVSATTTRRKRAGTNCSNPASSAGAIAGIISNGSPSEATTIRPYEIEAGEYLRFDVSNQLDLYLIAVSTLSATQNVHCQELSKK